MVGSVSPNRSPVAWVNYGLLFENVNTPDRKRPIMTNNQPAQVLDYPPLPDFDTVEQHIYGACRRYIAQDMLEPIHTLIRDAIDADRAARTTADSQPAPARDERDDFEKVFPLPSGCIRVGTGYASTGYSNWAAHTHSERWQGWQARAARAPADSVLIAIRKPTTQAEVL